MIIHFKESILSSGKKIAIVGAGTVVRGLEYMHKNI